MQILWDMFVTDRHNKLTTIKFDIIGDSSPLIVDLNLLQFANIDNTKKELSFWLLTNNSERTLATYIAPVQQNNRRARLLVLPHYRSTVIGLIGMYVYGQESHIVKKLHRVTHVSKHDMKELLRDDGIEI